MAPAGYGKDYLAKVLIDKGYVRLSFSDQLKKLCTKIFPWIECDYPAKVKETQLEFDTGFEKIEKSPREIWLKMGEIQRDIETNIFVRMLQETLDLMSTAENLIITDIRTAPEMAWIKQNGFTTVFIEATKQIYTPNDFDKQCISMKDQCDYVFLNEFDGTEKFEIFVNKLKD